ncbi:MAG TPA: hypothetical protein VFA07_07500 [Chthonomonadaceae bacterium]|nr:hypothetical protein [Chthonomonadaceae bacterium]
MNDLHEIVTVAQVETLFALLAMVVPLVGLSIGALAGARRRQTGRGALLGLGVGLIGPLNWLLWHLYNALTDRNGLDTVRNLVVNLALFLLIGAGLGVGIRFARSRFALSPNADTSSETNVPTNPDRSAGP